MKFLVFSDLHLDVGFSWASKKSSTKRRAALRKTLKNIVQLAVENDANAILCAGDLYEHRSYDEDTAEVVRELFESAPCPVLVSPGNHDFLDHESMYARVNWSDNVHIFDGRDFSPFSLNETCRVWGFAHHSPRGTPNPFDRARVEKINDVVDIALFHGSDLSRTQFELEDKVPHAGFEPEDIISSGFDYAFVGHFHNAYDGGHYCYPGNPDPLSFGEKGSQRGAVLATVESTGRVTLEWHDVSETTLHEIHVDMDGVGTADSAVALVTAAVGERTGFARIRLTGSVRPTLRGLHEALEQLDTELHDYQVVNETRTDYNIDNIRSQDTVQAQFIRMVEESEESSEDQRLLIEMGLRAFDGRTDLEVL